ncbi:MAG: histidine kinase [Cyclobacteriaceae bacterium]
MSDVRIIFVFIIWTCLPEVHARSLQDPSIIYKIDKVVSFMNSNPDSAYHVANKFALDYEREENGYGITQSYFIMAHIEHKIWGELDKATVNYLEAVRYAVKYEFERKNGMLIVLYKNLGIIFRQSRAFSLSIEYYMKAIDLSEAESDTSQYISSVYNLSRTYIESEKCDSAAIILKNITPILKVDRNYLKVLNNMGYALFCSNEILESIQVSTMAINKLKNIKESKWKHSRMGRIYDNLGQAFVVKGDYDSAKLSFRRALESKLEGNFNESDKASAISTVIDYAALLLKLNEPEESEKILLNSLKLTGTELKDFDGKIHEVFGLLAATYHQLNNVEKFEIYDDLYNAKLSEYIDNMQRYNMDLIVQSYFDQIEEEERAASIKFLGGMASGGLLVFVATFLIIVKIRTNRTKRKLERHEAGKKLAELKALKAQINPHFLFNSLNSIQSFILEDEKNIADEYLVKYGKLIRKILDHSNELTITLNDELEALQLYVELEQLRIKEGFAFEVAIQESIDPYSTIIPSMVIQPFIENAIWHGVSGQEGKGKIKLVISEKDDLMEVRVEDNGVGFDTNADQNNSSKGVRLVRERLELLKESAGQKSVVEIESKPGEGTTAILHFRNDLS